jgi:carbonic anhydrase/acetyltransferase-like protein (isoleucine patch superfamily)
VVPSREAVRRALLRSLYAWDRLRLAWLRWLVPGLDVHPSATPAFASARYVIEPGGKLRIGARAATERRPGALSFLVHAGGEIVIEEGAWLRTEVAPVVLAAFAGGRLVVGPEVLLNGCTVSAKREVEIERKAMVGPGSRVYDADQHDLDGEHREVVAPVRIGELAWVASDVTVMRGVTIGAHAVVGARSLVTRDVPPHTLVYGMPAEPRGTVGDRTGAR